MPSCLVCNHLVPAPFNLSGGDQGGNLYSPSSQFGNTFLVIVTGVAVRVRELTKLLLTFCQLQIDLISSLWGLLEGGIFLQSYEVACQQILSGTFMVEFTPQSLILYSFRLLHLHLVARGITWYLYYKFFEKNFLDFLPRRRFLFVLRLLQPSYVRWSPQGAAKSSPRRFEFVPEKCPDPSGFESRKQSRHYLPFQENWREQ